VNPSTSFEAYRRFVQDNHQLPKQLQDLDSATSELSYGSLPILVKEMWQSYAEKTLEACATDSSFEQYTAREKMLAYCYTLLEIIRADKNMISLQLKQVPDVLRNTQYSGFKQEFRSFTDILTEEGVQRGEIQARPFVSNLYPGLFWMSLVAIIGFWLNDSSEQTEQTDVAVEKIVHLVFDTIAPGAVDSAFDLAQFLIKQRFNG
jgi:hypothetical protein